MFPTWKQQQQLQKRNLNSEVGNRKSERSWRRDEPVRTEMQFRFPSSDSFFTFPLDTDPPSDWKIELSETMCSRASAVLRSPSQRLPIAGTLSSPKNPSYETSVVRCVVEIAPKIMAESGYGSSGTFPLLFLVVVRCPPEQVRLIPISPLSP